VVETIILINQCNGSYQTIRNFIIDNNLTWDDYYVVNLMKWVLF
jgi:hypothetical protein